MKQQAEEKIELHNQLHYLYLCLIRTLQVFDKQGELKEREATETTIRAAFVLMSELNNKSINKEVKTIRQLLPELFKYLDEAKRIVEKFKEIELTEESLKTICLAFTLQYQKNCIKAKKPERRNKYKDKRV